MPTIDLSAVVDLLTRIQGTINAYALSTLSTEQKEKFDRELQPQMKKCLMALIEDYPELKDPQIERE